MRNPANLKQSPLRPGNVITAAHVQTPEYRRSTDKHLAILSKRPYLYLHLGFATVNVTQLLHLVRNLVVHIAVLIATRSKHRLQHVLDRYAFVHIVITIMLHRGPRRDQNRLHIPPHSIFVTLHYFGQKFAKNLQVDTAQVASNTIFVFLR
jgi:hypothetical protein